MCRDKEAVSKWTRLLPPGPGVEVVELDGEGEEEEVVEEEEEDEAAAKRRKKTAYEKERIARQPVQRCGVDGCEYQNKDKSNFKRHQALKHGIGDVDAEELRRKQREYEAGRPFQRCGVDGCEFQTKYKGDLKDHQARVHGIGDVEAEELRRKEREYRARQPAQCCGVDGCEFQTKYKQELKRHQARVHGIGDVEAVTRGKKRRATQPKRSDEADFSTGNDSSENEVVAAAPRSRRTRAAVDYAELAGGISDGAKDSDSDSSKR
jgi:hypothetical protein